MRGRVHTPRARHGGFVAEGLRPLPWDLALLHGGSAHGRAHRGESHSLRAVQARLSPRRHRAASPRAVVRPASRRKNLRREKVGIVVEPFGLHRWVVP